MTNDCSLFTVHCQMSSHPNKYSFTPEEQYILELLQGDKVSVSSNLDVNQAHQFANRNGLSAYLFKIATSQKLPVDAALLSLLKKDYLKNLLRNTQITQVYKEVYQLLSDQQIEVIPLKGIFLSQYIYSDASVRPMSDIDMLILDDKATIAFDLLVQYGGIVNSAEWAEHDQKTGHHLPGIAYKGVLIEIHTSLFPLDVKENISNEVIQHNSISYQQITTLSPMLNLCYLCLHAYHTMRRGGIRLSWFLDLKEIYLSNYFYTDQEFLAFIKKLNIEQAVMEVLMKAEFVLSYTFPFIKDADRISLNTKEKKRFIQFIRQSEQQNTSYSYAIGWERLRNTNGIKNKLLFIKSVVFKEEHNTFRSVLKRLTILIKRTVGMLFRSLDL